MSRETRPYPSTATAPTGRNTQWSVAKMETNARAAGANSEERLLGIFDVLHDVFNRDDRDARSFAELLDELSRDGELDQFGAESLQEIRTLVAVLAGEADLSDIWEFTLSWRILMNGAISKAVAGDLDAPLRAKGMARDLIARHRVISAEAFPVSQQPNDGFALNFDTFDDGFAENGLLTVMVPASPGELNASAASHNGPVDFAEYVNEIESFYETHG